MSSENTITPGEGEKPECQQKTTSPVLTAERTEKPADHFGEANEMIPGKPLANHQPPNLPTANGGKAGLDNVLTVKPDVTVDAIRAVVREMMEGYSATDHNARAMADDTRNTVRELDKAAFQWLSALESRLAAVEPAPKPAAMVVKAPTVAKTPGLFTDAEMRMIHARDHAWRAALAEAGITIADEIQPSTKSRPAN